MPPPAPPQTPPGPVFPTYPPINLSLADLLREPDKFDGKLVAVTGNPQFVEAGKQTFDLRAGKRTVEVDYRYTAAAARDRVAAATPATRLLVTGLLRHLEAIDTWQILAQTIDLP